jgi:hypothetical protein
MQQLGEVGVALATLVRVSNPLSSECTNCLTQTIAVQTFVTIWWLIPPEKYIAFISVGVQWIFVILFVGIGFGLHTHPPGKYYATPTPVCHFHESLVPFMANIL